MDYLTRYAETACVPAATAQEAANFFLHQILLRHGAPQAIISDRGTSFVAKLLDELLRLCNTVHKLTSAYHPQTNGLTERFNRTLSQMMSIYVAENQTQWDVIVPYITFAYDTARQATTGFSPFYLLFARQPATTLDTVLPFVPDSPMSSYPSEVAGRADDARRVARLTTLQSQQQQQLRHDETHNDTTYEVGDQVILATPIRKQGKCEKLLHKYVGPFRILRRISSTSYEIEPIAPPRDHRTKSRDIVHISRMKRYNAPHL